jgi:hypothetical protein
MVQEPQLGNKGRQKIDRDSGRALATIFGGDDGAVRGGDQWT